MTVPCAGPEVSGGHKSFVCGQTGAKLPPGFGTLRAHHFAAHLRKSNGRESVPMAKKSALKKGKILSGGKTLREVSTLSMPITGDKRG